MKVFTLAPRNEKEFKNLIIFNILLSNKGLSRSDIAELTKINVVSISNYINSFIKKGLILEKKLGESTGGRPPVILELHKDNVYAIGIHITDSHLYGILINAELKTVNKVSQGMRADNFEQALVNIVNKLRDTIEGIKIKGIAVITEDENRNTETIEKILEDRIETDLYNDKPSISAAYAEIVSGTADNSIMLYSHKDLGDCVIFENLSFNSGNDSTKKDLAYLKPWPEVMGITHIAKEIIEKGVGTEIISVANGSIEAVTTKAVIEAAKKDDSVAIEILEFVALNLGVRLAYLINIFKPGILILGGGVEKAGEFFIKPLEKSIKRLAKEEMLGGLEIRASYLGEDAVAMGAAALVIREIFMGG